MNRQTRHSEFLYWKLALLERIMLYALHNRNTELYSKASPHLQRSIENELPFHRLDVVLVEMCSSRVCFAQINISLQLIPNF